uniref:Uncharacterized protein n=1 Tax=Oryza nivara TaxID=4536 RepID=A0A0E0HIM3_ORYNI
MSCRRDDPVEPLFRHRAGEAAAATGNAGHSGQYRNVDSAGSPSRSRSRSSSAAGCVVGGGGGGGPWSTIRNRHSGRREAFSGACRCGGGVGGGDLGRPKTGYSGGPTQRPPASGGTSAKVKPPPSSSAIMLPPKMIALSSIAFSCFCRACRLPWRVRLPPRCLGAMALLIYTKLRSSSSLHSQLYCTKAFRIASRWGH